MTTRATTLLVVGAAKSGTTSLCDYLGQHSDVHMAPTKEPVFFEAEYELGLDYYWSTYFPAYRGEAVRAEGRSYNLYLPFVPERIGAALPEARLVAILRDPVERAYSHWWHRTARAQERRSFADAVGEDLRRIESGEGRFEGSAGAERWRAGLIPGTTATRHATYVEMGYYAQQLERYLRFFPADRLRVYFYDDLARDPIAVVRDIWAMAGVDPDHPLADARIRNPARTERRSVLGARVAELARTAGVQRWLPAALWRVAKRSARGRPAQRPELPEAVREELTAHFEPHDRALATLLGRPVPYRAHSGAVRG